MDILLIDSGATVWQIIIMAILATAVILPLVALIDIVKSNFKDSTTKLIWVLIVLFAPLLGTLIYFAVGRQQKQPKRTFNPFDTNTTHA